MPTALVTGSAGFVGRRMVEALFERGYSPVTRLDVKDGPGRDARDYFRGSTERFDLVVHLAAVVGGRAMIEGDPLAVAVDLAIDAEMFQWAVRTRQPHILYFSSSAAYPVHLQEEQIPTVYSRLNESEIDLDDIASPDQTYGLAKLVGEIQAREARKHGVKVTVARPFSGTGPTQSLDYPVPAIIDRVVMREDPLTVWSDSVRDLVHIDDVVDIALHAVDLGLEEPFNIGSGIATSFATVARRAALAVGYNPEIRILDDKPTGVAYRVADPSFMQSFYFSPLHTVGHIINEMIEARTAAAALASA